MKLTFPIDVTRETGFGGPDIAVYSECARYRYLLTRHLNDAADPRTLGVVMLNPSTATAAVNDPTIRRVVGFAERWEYDRIIVGNLFAWRATKPIDLLDVDDPVGPGNSYALRTVAEVSDSILCAWGAWPRAQQEATKFQTQAAEVGVELTCLDFCASGAPRHPLYIKSDTERVRWPEQ